MLVALVLAVVVCAVLYVAYRVNTIENEVRYLMDARTAEWSELEAPLILPGDGDDDEPVVCAAAAPLPEEPGDAASDELHVDLDDPSGDEGNDDSKPDPPQVVQVVPDEEEEPPPPPEAVSEHRQRRKRPGTKRE